MAAVPVATFKESSRGPWGISSSKKVPGVQRRNSMSLLTDATPPAQKRPTEAIGGISYVNAYISEVGLPGRNTLPPLILDLYSSPNSDKETEDPIFISKAMAYRKGKATRKKAEHQKKAKHLHPATNDITDSMKDIHLDDSADTQLIELAAYPGYNPDLPTPLPHNMDTLEQMKRVTKAHPKLTHKLNNYQEAWCRLFYSPSSQTIFLDYYWWFFLHRYQPAHHVSIQDALFSRLSGNYVRLLCEPVEIKWRDSLFRMYPDAIAQCVYSTFICAYPNSWNNFDDAFKNELCLYISLWQVGTRPLPGLWTMWNLALLEPKNLLKHIGQEKHTEEKALDRKSSRTSKRGLLTPDRLSGKKRRSLELAIPEHMSPLSTPSSQRPSFGEVKKTLAGSKETLVPLVRHCHYKKNEEKTIEGVVPSASEEKRIGLAREQFRTLEKRSLSLPKPHHSELEQNGRSRAVRSSVNFDESVQRRPRSMSDPSINYILQAPQGLNSSGRQSPHLEVSVKSKSTKAKGSVKEKATVKHSVSQPNKPSTSKSTWSQQTSTMSSLKCNVRSLSETDSSHLKDMWQVTASSGITKTTDTYKQKCGELKKMTLEFKDRLAGEGSTPSIKGSEFEHVLFNLHGHSPLVKHYINNTRHSHINEKESIVGRTEILEEKPEKAVCYEDVLAESKKNSDRNHAMFQKYYKLQKHVIVAAHKKRLADRHKHEENVKLVLANRTEVQQLSNELTLCVPQRKKDLDKKEVTNAIRKVLSRVTK